jgi:heat-inducible transcriptional repressor
MLQLDARKRDILRAVIQAYVDTAEPVGSETLAHRARLGVSAATIRNEMAALEEMGLLAQPHTSAGRIPTDRGYRVYVDSMLEEEQLPADQRHWVRRRLAAALAEREWVPREVARALATLTPYASVVSHPHPRRLVFRHLHFVPLEATRVLAVIVTDAGVLRARTLDLPEAMDPDGLERLSRMVSQRLHGHPLGEITDALLRQVVEEAAWQHRVVRVLVARILRRLPEATRRVHIEGTANILAQPEFKDAQSARPVLRALEQEDVVADLLDDASDHPVWIAIGSEHRVEALRGCSVVVAAYRVGGRPAGALGIVGPTRMPYGRVVALVRYLADTVSQVLAEAR